MSDDGLLPSRLNALHPKYRSPYVSVIACSVVVSFMILWTFGELIIIDITLYGAALFMEYIALIRLRQLSPYEHRPFRIPLKIPGLVLMALLPFTVYIFALSGAFMTSGRAFLPIVFALIALLSAEVVYQLVQWRNRRKLFAKS